MAESHWFRMLSNSRIRAALKTSEHDIDACASTEQPQQSDAPTRSISEHAPLGHRAQLQAKTLSRLPSWQSLTHGHGPSHGHYRSADISGVDDDPDVIKEEKRLWENPSVDQMADTLLSILMAKPVREPLGAEYCSLALHVLEAYRDSSFTVAEMDKELAQEKERRQRLIEDYEALESSWTNQTSNYKAEIKRLELIIAKQGGTAAVQLARGASLIDRRSRHWTSQSSIVNSPAGTVRKRFANSSEDVPALSYPQQQVIHEGLTSDLVNSSVRRRRISDSGSDTQSRISDGTYNADPLVSDVDQQVSQHIVEGNMPPVQEQNSKEEDNPESADGSAEGETTNSSSSSSDENHEMYMAHRYLGARSRMRRPANLSATSSSSTVRIHRREFSFSAGDDGCEASGEF